MGRGFTLALVLVFLTATSTILTNPVSGANSAENTWVEKAPMHQARAWLGVAAVDGKIYAIGGSTASGFEPASFPYGNINADHFVGTNEEFDPVTNTWSFKELMPTPRMAFAAAAVNSKIYCIGGRSVAGDMSGGYTAVNEAYDPATDTWQTKAPMPVANGWITAKVVDGKIFIQTSTPYVTAGNFSVYDPATDSWNTSVPTPPDGKLLLDYLPNGYQTTGALSTKMVYTFDSAYNPTAKAYNPATDSWQTGAVESFGHTGFGVALVNGVFYLVGGYTYEFIGSFAPVATNEAYIPFGYGTPDPTYLLEHTPPRITVDSPLSQTYNDSKIVLIFAVDKSITSASYSLDGQENVTLTSNTTLANIPNGLHNLIIYANDTFGNVGSQTVSFNVEKPQTSISPNPNLIVTIVVSIAIVCFVVGLLLFRRHRAKIHSQATSP